jgi:NAD(P) transhydrogenase subunit alpha
MAMIVGVPSEVAKDEGRVALTPETAGRIQKLGYKLKIQKGAGSDANFSDDAYRQAGVEVVEKVGDLWKGSDIIMKVRPPADAEVKKLAAGKRLISFLYPGQNEALLKKLNGQKPEAVMAMDMVPRISRAQKLDALSSMANIAGYRAVVEAASNFGRFFTGQVTAAGKVPALPASPPSGRRAAWAPSSAPLTSARRSQNRSKAWAPSFFFSTLKAERAAPKAVTPSRPRRNLAKSS